DELGRQPLTNREALSLARAVTRQSDPRLQAQAMQELVGQVSAAYGPHAQPVLNQILQARGMDREMAAYGAQMFTRMDAGQRPGRAAARQGGVLAETAAADAAGQPRAGDAFPLPNY